MMPMVTTCNVICNAIDNVIGDNKKLGCTFVALRVNFIASNVLPTTVTRFGKIVPLWQNFKSLWANFEWLI